MHGLFKLKHFITYQWRAQTKYYLHSPFVYHFYLDVLERGSDENLKAIQALRKELTHNNTDIHLDDLGTGKKERRKISAIATGVEVQPKYGEVLYRMVKKFNPPVIVELGTSIGLSSCYMALGNKASKVVTIEGSERLIEIANNNYAKLGLGNVETVNGNFDDCLEEVLSRLPLVGLVFFDGNHRKEATLGYFNQCLAKADENSVFIFDDIYWSPEMTEAWEEIKRHERIKLTIDIYQFGICFFLPSKLAKEDFVLRY